MGVALVTSFPVHTGGAHSHMRSLHQGLTRHGQRASLHFNRSKNIHNLIGAVVAGRGGVERTRIEYKRRTLETFGAAVELALDEVDVAHFHDVFACAVSPTRAPRVLTVHGPASREATMTFPHYENYVDYVRDVEMEGCRRADRIIAVDTGQKAILVGHGVNESKIRVIMNAVDIDYFRPATEQTEGRYLLVPRRLVGKNGVNVAIDAMRHVADPTIRLLIAGDGPDRASLSQRARSAGLETRVIFLGSIPHSLLLSLIQRALAVVVPSVPVAGIIEASSISVLEGMGCGRVVIASAIGGLAEMIRDGENGILFEAGNAEQLAAKIAFVTSDSNLRDVVGQAARRHVVAHHSIGTWTMRTMAVYEEAIAARQSLTEGR